MTHISNGAHSPPTCFVTMALDHFYFVDAYIFWSFAIIMLICARRHLISIRHYIACLKSVDVVFVFGKRGDTKQLLIINQKVQWK